MARPGRNGPPRYRRRRHIPRRHLYAHRRGCHRQRTGQAERGLPAWPDDHRGRGRARSGRIAATGRHVSEQDPHCLRPATARHRSGRRQPDRPVSACRVRFSRPRPGKPRRGPLRRPDGRISDAGRSRGPCHCRHRHWRRRIVLSRSPALQHRHTEGSGRNEPRHHPHLRPADRAGSGRRQCGRTDCRAGDHTASGHCAGRLAAGQRRICVRAGRVAAGQRLRPARRPRLCRNADPARAAFSGDGTDARPRCTAYA